MGFFDRFGADDAIAIRALGAAMALPAGEPLFARGDPAHRFFTVERGLLHVVVSSTQGRALVLRRLGPGEVVGEIALFTEGHRSASVVAQQDTELLAIDARDVRDLMSKRPGIAVALLEVLAERMRALTGQIEDSFFLPMRARLAKTLLELATEEGIAEGGRLTLKEPVSQALLGKIVYGSREEISREFRRWTERGWIRREDGSLEILDGQALASVVAGSVDT